MYFFWLHRSFKKTGAIPQASSSSLSILSSDGDRDGAGVDFGVGAATRGEGVVLWDGLSVESFDFSAFRAWISSRRIRFSSRASAKPFILSNSEPIDCKDGVTTSETKTAPYHSTQ